MYIALVSLLTVLACSGAAPQSKPVPVEDEPFHKTVFKNEFIQAFRVQIAPKSASKMHTHAHDDAAVRLSSATATDELLDGTISAPASFEPGLVTGRRNEPTPTTHSVHNVGDTLFDVMDVQILRRPPGPEAPPVDTPAAENPQMRMYRYELAPGASTKAHTHARPFLLVAATPVDLGIASPSGTPQRRSMKLGDLEWIDAAVTHTFVNHGTATAILVEFELK